MEKINIAALGFPWKTKDPFLFCVYHKDLYPLGNGKGGPIDSLEGRNLGSDFQIKDGWRMYHGNQIPGFPAHPHRGFETITIAEKGIVDHSDSMGAAGRFGNGDVQWMTAGKGVQHSEMFPLLDTEQDNTLELFQIWLNLPKSKKFVPPHFKMLWRENIPKVVSEKEEASPNWTVKVIAGKYEATPSLDAAPDSWASIERNHVNIWIIEIEKDCSFQLPPTPEGVNRALYFYSGSTMNIESTPIQVNQMAELNSEDGILLKNGNQKAYLLYLTGRPIAEPVVQQGPFVMNTNEEIHQAIKDYQFDQYGGWPWQHMENIHPLDKNRFADHANGIKEEKEGL